MPQLSNLVLNDRAATPVAHTFVPRGINKDGVATLVKNDGTFTGEQKFSLRTARNGNTVKTRIILARPVVQTETVNGIARPKVVRTASADLTFVFNSDSSEQERTDLVGMLASALGVSQALVHQTVVKGEDIY